MKLKIVAIASSLLLTLTGCSGLMDELNRDLLKSDVTKEELQTLLLTKSDLPGFTIMPETATERAERIEITEQYSLNANTCSKKVSEIGLGEYFIDEQNFISVSSIAEPTCVSASLFKEATEEASTEGTEKLYRTSLEQDGGEVTYLNVTKKDIGLGEDILSYNITANIDYSDFSVIMDSWDVSIFTDKATVTLTIDSYNSETDFILIQNLVNITRSKIAALESQ
jgi:hypothetical protein